MEASICLLMTKKRSGGISNFILRVRVNRILAARGAGVRIAWARSAGERETLGDYFLVRYPDRHIIVRDHVDLYELAREVGALVGGTAEPLWGRKRPGAGQE